MDDVKAIIFGKRTASDLVAALRASPHVADSGIDVVPTLDRDWTRIVYRLAGNPAARRELWMVDGEVFPDAAEASAKFYAGPRMLLRMDALEGCTEVMRSVVAPFGGFLCPSAYEDEWQPVEIAAPLSPDGELRLRLAKLLGPDGANAVSAVLDDREKLAALRDVLDGMLQTHEADAAPALR
jgi:hypothetical protein